MYFIEIDTMDRFSMDEKVFATKLNYLNITFDDIVVNPLQRCIKSAQFRKIILLFGTMLLSKCS